MTPEEETISEMLGCEVCGRPSVGEYALRLYPYEHVTARLCFDHAFRRPGPAVARDYVHVRGGGKP